MLLAASIPATTRLRAQVLSITDGDTVRVRVLLTEFSLFDMECELWGKNVSMRLRGVNARELYMDGGKEARENLKAVLPVGTEVVLSRLEADKYAGRYVGSILLPTGQDLATKLIDEKWAAPYNGTGLARDSVPPWPRVT